MRFLKEEEPGSGPNRYNGELHGKLFIDVFNKQICTVAADQSNNRGVLLPIKNMNIIVNYWGSTNDILGNASSRHICAVDNLLHFGYEDNEDGVLHFEGEDDGDNIFDEVRNKYDNIYRKQSTNATDKDSTKLLIIEEFLKIKFEQSSREEDFIRSPDHGHGSKPSVTSSDTFSSSAQRLKNTEDVVISTKRMPPNEAARRKEKQPSFLEAITEDVVPRRKNPLEATEMTVSYFDIVEDKIFKRFGYFSENRWFTKAEIEYNRRMKILEKEKIKMTIWMIRPEKQHADKDRICTFNGIYFDNSMKDSWVDYNEALFEDDKKFSRHHHYNLKISKCELLMRYEYFGRGNGYDDDVLMYILVQHPPKRNAMTILKVTTVFYSDGRELYRLMEFDTTNTEDDFRVRFPGFQWISKYVAEITKLIGIIIEDHTKMKCNENKMGSNYKLSCQFICASSNLNGRPDNIPHDYLGMKILHDKYGFTRKLEKKGKRIKGSSDERGYDIYSFSKSFPRRDGGAEVVVIEEDHHNAKKFKKTNN